MQELCYGCNNRDFDRLGIPACFRYNIMDGYANLSTILGGKGNHYATVSMSVKS